MDIGFELEDRLGGEGMRHDLALAAVLSTVARVEEAAADRDEGIIEFTVSRQYRRTKKSGGEGLAGLTT